MSFVIAKPWWWFSPSLTFTGWLHPSGSTRRVEIPENRSLKAGNRRKFRQGQAFYIFVSANELIRYPPKSASKQQTIRIL